jgi:hypothetical protein
MPEHKISIYNQARPTRLRSIRGRFKAEWELVAEDENTPNRNAARSQLAACVAKNCTASRKISRARCRRRISTTRNYENPSATRLPRETA